MNTTLNTKKTFGKRASETLIKTSKLVSLVRPKEKQNTMINFKIKDDTESLMEIWDDVGKELWDAAERFGEESENQ